MQTESHSRSQRVAAIVGAIVALAIFELLLVPRLFRSAADGFNVTQFICAGISGGVGSWIGGFFGRMFERD
jgi:hypothetical protein